MKSMMDRDPLSLKKISAEDKHKKILYGLVIGILVCFALALLFFIISLAVSSASSQNQSGITITNSQGKEVRLTQAEINQQYQEIGKSPSDIRMLMKIMPSANTKKNVIFMKYNNFTKKSKDNSFHSFNNTKNYFASLHFDQAHVPAGDSKTLCIHALWTTVDHDQQIDTYQSVQDFPICQNSQNVKMRWNEHDPVHGIDIKAWDQSQIKMSCSSDAKCKSSCRSKGGLYGIVEGSRVGCFKYKVLKKFCIKIQPKIGDPHGWKYAGGCFSDGKATEYVKAKPSQVYNFHNVQMEVRTTTSDKQTIFPVEEVQSVESTVYNPYAPILRYNDTTTAEEIQLAEQSQDDMLQTDNEDRGVLGWIAFILFFAGLILIIVFGFLSFYWWQKKDQKKQKYNQQFDENEQPERRGQGGENQFNSGGIGFNFQGRAGQDQQNGSEIFQ